MSIGKNIQNYRKDKGLTQKELAEILGLATGTIQQYELDKRQPRLETLGEIAKALDVPIFSLLPNGEMPESQFNEYFGDLIKQKNAILNTEKENTFFNYLLSLGYEIYESPYNEKWTIHILGSDSEIYLTDDEMKLLEHSTKENVDLRISSYLHDGNHMQ